MQLKFFQYDVGFVGEEFIGELARRCFQKEDKSFKLLRYNNHICYVNRINALFKTFQCTASDKFFPETGNLEGHLVTCSERVKHLLPKNNSERRETLYNKLYAFKIPYKEEQKLFTILVVFLFQRRLLQGDRDYEVDREAFTDISF